jgi:hypothetical protein
MQRSLLGNYCHGEIRCSVDEASLIQCEYRFENFNARGDEDYLNQFARRLDELFRVGWTAPEVNRDPAFKGWWQLCLVKADGLDFAKPPSRS